MHLQSPPFWWLMTNWLKFSIGIKVCEIVKDKGIVFVSSKRLPLKMCIYVICFWNANAHGRFYLWRSSSTYEDNSSCMIWCNKDNDMHNEKWMSAKWLKCGSCRRTCGIYHRITHSLIEYCSRRPSVLSVTTQRTKCIKSESCKHLQKYSKPPRMTCLKTINSYASPPFVSKDQKGLKT